MWRNLFIIISFFLLLASIPVGIYLVKQQQDLRSRASTIKVTSIEITGPNVKNLHAVSPDVLVQLNFVPDDTSKVFPSAFRIANQLSALDSAPEQTFKQNAQEINWKLDNVSGPRTVYAQFKVNNLWKDTVSASVYLDPPAN